MENEKQMHGTIPQNLLNLRYSRTPKEDAHRHYFDSFCSLPYLDNDDDEIDDGNQRPWSPSSFDNGPLVPPSDRFFVAPSTSASLAGECEYDTTLPFNDHDGMNPMVPPSDRFFISTSTSASLTLHDSTAQKNATSKNRPLVSMSQCSTSLSSSLASDSTTANQQDATSSSASSNEVSALNGVAVSTYSEDPCEDFRKSMEEMIDLCQVEKSKPLDWDFMEDLLFCYLELNERSVHRYIIQAFAVVVGTKLKVMSFSGD